MRRPFERISSATLTSRECRTRKPLAGGHYCHDFVVLVLGIAALLLGAVLPDWVDPILEKVVGITLVLLGIWVLFSVYQYLRGKGEFRLRSRWMLVFDFVRYGWGALQARIHGHEHTPSVHASQYGPKTAFGVGMIHGVG